MAYSETVADSPEDLINVIATFASANGWTIDESSLSGANRTLSLHRSGDYIHIYNTSTTELRIAGSLGFIPATLPLSQPGASTAALCNLQAGPYAKVHLFADTTPAEHIFVVVETSGGIYYHIAFGMLDKFGTYTGGTFFDCSYWYRVGAYVHEWRNTHSALFDHSPGAFTSPALVGGSVRCDIPADGFTDNWARMSSSAAGSDVKVRSGLNASNSNTALDGASWLTTSAYARNDAPFSGQVMLGSIRLYASRTGATQHWSPIGVVPNIRYLNMQRFTPGQEVTIGGDVWKIFPMARYGVGVVDNGDPDNVYSAYHGYAYKKVV